MARKTTRQQPVARLTLAAAAALAAMSAGAGAEVIYQTVALGGQAAPGAGAGVTYQNSAANAFNDFFAPSLNSTGHVAYRAVLAGTGVTTANDNALFAGPAGFVNLLAREGDAAPGTTVLFGNLGLFPGAPVLNDSGLATFETLLVGGGVTTANDEAIYAGIPGGPLTLVAREASQAAGLPAGVNYGTLTGGNGQVFLNDAGHLVFSTILSGTGVTTTNNEAIFAGPPGALAPVIRKGDQVPGLPAGVNYGSLFFPALNDAGHVTFKGRLAGAGVTTSNDDVIIAGPPASPTVVAREGSQAAGFPAGTNYVVLSSSPTFPSLSDSGHVAFVSATTAPTGGFAVFAGMPDSVALVANEGDQVPGLPAGVTYGNLLTARSLGINDAGRVAFAAILSGTGVTAANDEALFTGLPGSTPLVAREGSQAGGLPAGVNYGEFRFDIARFEFNDLGQIAFISPLTGTGVTGANDEALFLFDPVAGTQVLAREGDVIDVGGGDMRTIDDLLGIGFIAAFAGDDTANGLGNDNRLVLRLGFTDGSEGIFTAVVPEPGAVAAVLLPAVFSRRRRPGFERGATGPPTPPAP